MFSVGQNKTDQSTGTGRLLSVKGVLSLAPPPELGQTSPKATWGRVRNALADNDDYVGKLVTFILPLPMAQLLL